jgi:hypothetical protein
MTKQEKIAEIAEQTGLSEGEVAELVDLLKINLDATPEEIAEQARLLAADEARPRRHGPILF